ncbi:MAG: hypothetical protein ABJI50_14640 [Sulfitobacter pontiacus]|uniref:hypothetical protein n=2 Tax=Roseobacteraceae TaxID=2854170 RepID=UPI00328846AF
MAAGLEGVAGVGLRCCHHSANGNNEPNSSSYKLEEVEPKDQNLFSQLSNAAEAGLEGLYIGMEWDDLVTQFLDDPQNQTGWVTANSLTHLS